MPDIESDLRYLEAGLDQIEDYLASKEIYWHIGLSSPFGGPGFPQLTLDGLLLSAARLQARLGVRSLNPEQAQRFMACQSRLDDVRASKPVAWEKKSLQLYRARLNLWQNFLNEYREDPDGFHDAYGYEVSRRVELDLLAPFAEERSEAEENLLATMDSVLKSSLEPGGFVWEADLAEGFPRQRYWYLYGRLKRKAV